jgi:RNA polymerase II subunit A small phosphatase-like protein
MLMILDLDETLIHASETRLTGKNEDFIFDKYFVYKRPHLEYFLQEAAKHFTLGIWSSAGDEYVNGIVNTIRPPIVNFEFVWARSKCSLKRDRTYDTYYFEKRLDKLKKRGFPLEQILIVDDTAEKASSNYGNAIYIKEFTGNPEDSELLFLLDYILTLKNVANVRTIEKRFWRVK